MQRVEIQAGLDLSRIVYGMWRLADDQDVSAGNIIAKVEACLAQGITTMDHADIYGGYTVEEHFGRALKGTGLRDKIEIVTKCGIVAPTGDYAGARLKHYNTSAQHISASIDRSLRLLGTDYIDLLLIHRPDPFMDFTETGGALDAAVSSGKVRAVGVSNFRPWDLAALQSCMQTKLVVNQIELSLLARDPFTNGDLSSMTRDKVRAMAWSPLGGGRLFSDDTDLGRTLDRIAAEQGVDRTAIAVAWLLAHPAHILPVMGTNNVARIRQIGDAMKVKLSREDWFELYSTAEGRDVP